jgi:putative transposase
MLLTVDADKLETCVMSGCLPQRKRPVHMPPVERFNAPVVLFVTLAIRSRVPAFANAHFHAAWTSALSEANAWRVSLYVIMPDHIHLFCVPSCWPRMGVKPWCEYLKRRITSHMGPHPEWDWLPGCWDTQLRDQAHYDEKASYVRMNPVRAGLVETPQAWLWRGEGEPVLW